MKRVFITLLVLLMCTGVCFVAGCGGCSSDDDKDKYHVSLPDTKSHTQADYSFPDEAKLGLPLYKKNVVSSSVESSSEETDGVLKHVGVDFTTSDDFKTVVAWYTDQMGGPPTKTFSTTEGKQQVSWEKSEGGYHNLIVVTETADGTAVSAIKDKELPGQQ